MSNESEEFNSSTPAQLSTESSELVTLIIQQLSSFGLEKSASFLEKESGIKVESEQIAQFKEAVHSGNWKLVIHQLSQLGNMEECIEIVKRQEYLETIERGELEEAVYLLRHLKVNDEQMSMLSLLLMCDQDEFYTESSWDGKHGTSRNALLFQIQEKTNMIPDNRLSQIVDAYTAQVTSMCEWHNTKQPISILHPHTCTSALFPLKMKHVLSIHTDEVWYVTYSPSGTHIASASRDTTASLYSLSSFTSTKLSGHTAPVTYIKFSPSSEILLTCSNDKSCKLWNIQGECLKTFTLHSDVITTCAFVTETTFLSGSSNALILASTSGIVIKKWVMRVHDMCYHENTVITISDKKIRVMRLDTGVEKELLEGDAVTSISLSKRGDYLLVNLCTQMLRLWHIESGVCVKEYRGVNQGKFVIRSCFGGVDERFVVSGSEDQGILVWNRQTGKLLKNIEGHEGCVNSVAYHPTENEFVSCSDDHSVRLWTV